MRSFLWHDYETFGANPRCDRPSQFAAIRTDAELNEIEPPIELFCTPTPDYLPQPQACLITGITPQHCLQYGIPEYQFAQRIEQAFSQPGTVGTGYNSFHFDDEVTRFLFWRNLIDPYAREWQNDCGRWDLLNVMRAAYALRPEGIVWPVNGEGRTSFKLEHLSAANGLAHTHAHDAVSDVRATIALARLLRQHQTRLYDFCLELRHKATVAAQISLHEPRPFLHVSGMVPAERGCLMLAWPLAAHPFNKNEVIVWDLAYDPEELFTLDADSVRTRLFSKTEDLPAGQSRLPIKSIHLNRAPIVIGQTKTLSPAQAERWDMNLDAQLRHAETLRLAPKLDALWQEVYRPRPVVDTDIEQALYNGFINNEDRRTLQKLSLLEGEALMHNRPVFADARLPELLFRYRARNFPQHLSPEEQARWQQHCKNRLFHGGDGLLTLQSFSDEIDQLAETANERDEAILADLYDYASDIAPTGN